MTRSGSIVLPWLVFVAAALLEVGGDAVVRQGLRGRGGATVLGGCLMLAGYGLVVNLVTWDFSRLLGAYVAAFAVVERPGRPLLVPRGRAGLDLGRPGPDRPRGPGDPGRPALTPGDGPVGGRPGTLL